MNRRFYISPQQTEQETITVMGQDARHMARVLRLKPGDRVELFDGGGTDYEAEIQRLTSNSAELHIIRSYPGLSEPPVHITAAQGLLKERKVDQLIRPLTELGVAEWIPYISRRSVPAPDAKKMAARQQRWEKIAIESLKQCRRSQVLKIRSGISYDDLLTIAEPFDLKIVFWESETRPFTPEMIPPETCRRIFILLGPEGGLSSEEVDRAVDAGFIRASLGPRILRAETAAITACALVQYLFGDLGKNT